MAIKKIKNKRLIFGWIGKAEDDLSFAEMAFKETEFYDHVCFLSQQAVEKYLKMVIVASKGINLSDFEKHLRILSEAYIPARYPADGYVKFNKKEAKECLEAAQKVIEFIKNKIHL